MIHPRQKQIYQHEYAYHPQPKSVSVVNVYKYEKYEEYKEKEHLDDEHAIDEYSHINFERKKTQTKKQNKTH